MRLREVVFIGELFYFILLFLGLYLDKYEVSFNLVLNF